MLSDQAEIGALGKSAGERAAHSGAQDFGRKHVGAVRREQNAACPECLRRA
jgi:hypothetical protein